MLGKIITMLARRQTIKSVFLLLIMCMLVLSLVIVRKKPLLKSMEPVFDSSPENILHSTKNMDTSPVKIGLVTCSGRVNITYSIATYETLTLIKSIMVSASIHNVTSVDFHIFVDTYELQRFLNEVITEFSFNKIGNMVEVRTYFYNVFKSVPRGNVGEFIKSQLRCTYLRIFFPNVLKSVDEILYLDTDTLVTGNIGEIWRKFHEMAPQKLVAIARNNEVDNENNNELDEELFGDIPHVPPKGVNVGVIYMNLVGLRKFGWTEKLLQLYRQINQSEIHINDQRLINMFLYYNLDILEILPCHYNFQLIHCQEKFLCRTAASDPFGIQIFHGTGDSFYREELFYYHLFQEYTNFDLGDPSGHIEGLLKPIKEYYNSVKNGSTCNGLLEPLLYKNIVL